MKYPCTVKQLIDGDWLATSLGTDVGNVRVTAPSRQGAIDLLALELRYRMEWCPCSAVADDFVELDVKDEAPVSWKGSVF